ncbi:MAG: hypothetical protein WCG90_03415 [Chitinophagia bacterium]
MKKAITLFTLVIFMFTTLIMPYSNYEDAKAVISLYKNSLRFDEDMNFAEFIGEKLIASGLEFDEEEDAPMQTNKIPRSHDEVIQIQNGVLFHKHEVLIEFATYIIPIKIGPDFTTKINNEDFCPGIFRPPSA